MKHDTINTIKTTCKASPSCSSSLFYLPSEQTSEQLGACLAAHLAPPLTLTFSGDIGMGKTTIIRALLRACGVTSAVKSPTFSLIESYDLKTMQFHHFDLYRVHDETELDYIGFRDYFDSRTVCCIEWPEKGKNYTRCADLAFKLTKHEQGRMIEAEALTPQGNNLLMAMIQQWGD